MRENSFCPQKCSAFVICIKRFIFNLIFLIPHIYIIVCAIVCLGLLNIKHIYVFITYTVADKNSSKTQAFYLLSLI